MNTSGFVRHYARRYVIAPFRQTMTSPSFLILVVFVLVLGEIQSNSGIFDILLPDEPLAGPGELIYEHLPQFVIPLLRSRPLIAASTALYMFQTVLAVIMAANLKFIYQDQRLNLLDTARQVSLSQTFWFMLWDAFYNIVFASIAAAFYVPGLLLWHRHGVDTAIPVLGIGIALMPLYIACASVGVKLAVLSTSWQGRFQRMRHIFTWRNLRKIYIFYPARWLVEGFCIIGVPVIALALFGNRLLAILAGGIALLIPMALFRASTFVFFLELYADDTLVRETFQAHYYQSKEVKNGIDTSPIVRHNSRT